MNIYMKGGMETGEVAQRALAALAEDLVSVPSTHMVAPTICNEIWCPLKAETWLVSHPQQLRPWNPMLTSSTEPPSMLQHCQDINLIHFCPLQLFWSGKFLMGALLLFRLTTKISPHTLKVSVVRYSENSLSVNVGYLLPLRILWWRMPVVRRPLVDSWMLSPEIITQKLYYINHCLAH